MNPSLSPLPLYNTKKGEGEVYPKNQDNKNMAKFAMISKLGNQYLEKRGKLTKKYLLYNGIKCS